MISDLKTGETKVAFNVIDAALKALALSEELNPLVDFIKLKRGLGKTTDDWERLKKSYESLTVAKENPASNIVDRFNTLNLHITNYKELLFVGEGEKIDAKMQKLFVHYKEETKNIKEIFTRELKPSTSKRQQEAVENEMLSFMYSQIYYKMLLESDLEMYRKVYQNPQLVVNKLKALYRYIDKTQDPVFTSNTFLNKVKYGVLSKNSIEIPSFAKMSGKDQTSLIDGFESLFRNTLNLDITEKVEKADVSVDKNLAKELIGLNIQVLFCFLYSVFVNLMLF